MPREPEWREQPHCQPQLAPTRLNCTFRRVWKRSQNQWRQGKGPKTKMSTGCGPTPSGPQVLFPCRPSSSGPSDWIHNAAGWLRSILFAESLGTEPGSPCGQGHASPQAWGLSPGHWLSELLCTSLSSPWVRAPGPGKAPALPPHRCIPAGNTFEVQSGLDEKAAFSPALLASGFPCKEHRQQQGVGNIALSLCEAQNFSE